MRKGFLVAPLVIALIGCGGSGSSSGSKSKLVDPSGNWNMRFTSGVTLLQTSGMMDQVGADVSEKFNITFINVGNTPTATACYPYATTLSNGLVQNVNQFSGTYTIVAKTGEQITVNFVGTLTPDGLSVAGTYTTTSGQTSGCFPVPSSGALAGEQVPSVTGSWTGTIQPCQWNQQTGTCPLTSGTSPTVFAMTVTQNDATATVSGTYNAVGFGSGNISTGQFDLLSGNEWQFTLTDNSSAVYTVAGAPFNNSGINGRNFTGAVMSSDGNHFWWLTVSH